MPGLVDCGVVLRTALPSGNAFFTAFDQSLQGTVYLYFWLITIYYDPTWRKYGRTRFLQKNFLLEPGKASRGYPSAGVAFSKTHRTWGNFRRPPKKRNEIKRYPYVATFIS